MGIFTNFAPEPTSIMNRLNTIERTVILAAVVAFYACAGSPPTPPARLPDSEIPAYREAAHKLARYIVMEDSSFHLTITEDSAARLGIPGKYFKRAAQELEYTNYLIHEEYNKKGIPVEMPEYNTDSLPRP